MAQLTGDDLIEPEDTLGFELARHARLMHVMRSHLAAWAPSGLDFAAFGLLITLVKHGPRRQGELAETALLDPSTVSRQVAQLVRAGLAERRADAADGRAVRIHVTAAGEQLGAELVGKRRAMLREVIADWPADDVAVLIGLLRKLNDDVEGSRYQLSKPWPTSSPTADPPSPRQAPHDTPRQAPHDTTRQAPHDTPRHAPHDTPRQATHEAPRQAPHENASQSHRTTTQEN